MAATNLPEAVRQQRRQVADAVQTLKVYNPDFSLTPEVLEIMRTIFADLRPDEHGTITRGVLADEIARLDPNTDTKRHVRHEWTTKRDERLDFTAFCDWVMQWKAQNPQSVQTVYTSWATQIAAMSENDSLDLDLDLKAKEKVGPKETLTLEILQLLQSQQGTQSPHQGADLRKTMEHPFRTMAFVQTIHCKQNLLS